MDEIGRLCRVTGLLHPPSLGFEVSKRRHWQRVCAFGLIRDSLCDQQGNSQYQYVPVIPQELGGVNSPLNEVLMSTAALRQYRPHFEDCLRKQTAMIIDVKLDYGPDDKNMAIGLQKPISIPLKLSDDGQDELDDSIEIIYH